MTQKSNDVYVADGRHVGFQQLIHCLLFIINPINNI